MPNLEQKRHYPAFTLLEMLVVLSIFMIFSTITVSAFSGLRDTVSLNEDILNLEQDVRYAQRSAMFLDREVGERWIYGIGIDFSRLEEEKAYNLFKWCSQYDEYGPIKTTSPIPNFDPNVFLSSTNGSMPSSYTSGSCDSGGLGASQVFKILGEVEGSITSNMNISVGILTDTDVIEVPKYILFEAVSGRMFMYNGDGIVLNYNSDGELVGNPTDFIMEISSPNTEVGKRITLGNISGKLLMEKFDE